MHAEERIVMTLILGLPVVLEYHNIYGVPFLDIYNYGRGNLFILQPLLTRPVKLNCFVHDNKFMHLLNFVAECVGYIGRRRWNTTFHITIQ